MKLLRAMVLVAAVSILGGVAYFAEEQAPLGVRMTDAAQNLLGALSDEQRTKVSFDFDDKERFNYAFVPLQDKDKKSTRKGLRLEEMTDGQKKAVLELLKTGTSEKGFEQAVTIMSLESILHDLEKNGAMVRNPNWYFVSIFGKPAKTGKWGWRIEGHHLSLNFTIVDGQVQSATPAFFGANPAYFLTGEKRGKYILGEALEDSARELFRSLTDEQKKLALQEKHFGEPTQHVAAEKVGEPVGIPGEKLHDPQKKLLEQLLKEYTSRMPEAVAAAQWKTVTDGGLDKVYFAYSGGLKNGEPHTYRVQGPKFIVQFLNVQDDSAKNKANHIHSAWRELPSDFGVR